MTRNSADSTRYNTQHYREDLLTWRRQQMGISIREVARRGNARFDTVRRVFKGNATNKIVFPIVQVLGLDWAQVHNLDLQESDFHLAVLNGSNGNGANGSAG